MDNISSRPPFVHFTAKTREWQIVCICLACIALFAYTACSKLMDHERFQIGLSDVKLIGSFSVYLSWLVPVIELIVVTLMIIPATYTQGLFAFILLMGTFTCYIISILIWAKELPCRCGGAIERLSWTQHVWFNMAFIVMAIYALLLSKNNNVI
jgi:hypothetical protein